MTDRIRIDEDYISMPEAAWIKAATNAKRYQMYLSQLSPDAKSAIDKAARECAALTSRHWQED